MNCSKHVDVPAVGQCQKCGAYVCNDCAEMTEAVRDLCGVLCPKCYAEELTTAVAQYKKENKVKITRTIVCCVLYILGIIAIVYGANNSQSALIVVGILLCGLYTGISSVISMARGNARGYGIIAKLLILVISIVLGLIVTPIRCIIDTVSIIKNNNLIKKVSFTICVLMESYNY